MRRRSVAQADAADTRAHDEAQSPAQRVALALALGRRDIEWYARANGLDPTTARLLVERRRQARRLASPCMEDLLR
jgi:hypothetical protein